MTIAMHLLKNPQPSQPHQTQDHPIPRPSLNAVPVAHSTLPPQIRPSQGSFLQAARINEAILAEKFSRILWCWWFVVVVGIVPALYRVPGSTLLCYVIFQGSILCLGKRGMDHRSTCLLTTYTVVKLFLVILSIFFITLDLLTFSYLVDHQSQNAISLLIRVLLYIIPFTLAICSVNLSYRLRNAILLTDSLEGDEELAASNPMFQPRNTHVLAAGTIEGNHHSHRHHHHHTLPVQLQPVYYFPMSPTSQHGSVPLATVAAQPFYPQLLHSLPQREQPSTATATAAVTTPTTREV